MVHDSESAVPLVLDTKVDGKVDFTALSAVLPRTMNGSRELNGLTKRVPRVPVAGSSRWLSSMVEVGRREALHRDMLNDRRDDDSNDSDGSPSSASEAFFAVDLECVLHKYRRWHECFPRVKPFYAVKCNPNREVVRVLAKASGCGFDCASPAEMDQVLECGVDPSRIIYANPCKDLAALEHALNAGVSTMTFDSKDELYKIRRLLDSRRAMAPALAEVEVEEQLQLVLRLRVPDSHSDCPLGEKYGAAEQACSGLISLAVELRLPLVGISFHCGSGCQNAQAYPDALAVAKFVFDLAARLGVRLTLLDIGGGFPGWDGSEWVYGNGGGVNTGGRPAGTGGGTVTTAAAGAQTGPGGGPAGGSGASPGLAGAQVDDGRERTGRDGTAALPPPPPPQAQATPPSPPLPLSLAVIAQVTLPVLDELFPPSSGVQVIAEPGRYFVEASHILFARIYAKRSLNLTHASRAPAPAAPLASTSDVASDAGGGGVTAGRRKTTAYYIDEGVNGCFKDKVLCGVNFEPCPVSLPGRRRRERAAAAAAAKTEAVAASVAAAAAAAAMGAVGEQEGGGKREEAESNAAIAAGRGMFDKRGEEVGEEDADEEEEEEEDMEDGEEEEEEAVVMGPSGLPADVVASKRLPKSLEPGDWLYFTRMGAYTASIATVASSSALSEASYCYVGSSPAGGSGGTSASRNFDTSAMMGVGEAVGA